MRIIPFDVIIPDDEQDKALSEKLEAEAQGILRWAVEGAVAWRAEGLAEPAAILDATLAYRASMDIVGAFLEEMTTEDDEARVPMSDLYAAFVEWFVATHPGRGRAFVMEMRPFGETLEKRGYPPFRGSKGVAIRRGLVLRRSTSS